jgi:hypothetical protein
VFSLRARDGTMELARQCAEASPEMRRLWEEEEAAAGKRRDSRWEEVLVKQRTITRLLKEVKKLQEQSDEADAEASKNRLYDTRVQARKRCSGLNDEIRSKNGQIERERTPPAPVLQPLPADRSNAMPVIFFLKMPRCFQVQYS